MSTGPRRRTTSGSRSVHADTVGTVVQAGGDVRVGTMHFHAAEPAPVPRQLPSPPRVVDRDEARAALATVLAATRHPATAPTVLISGGPGIGKTTVALACAWDHADSYPGGALWADLRGHSRLPAAHPSDVLAFHLRALGVRETRIGRSLDERAAQYRTLTAARPVLVVLDDAASADQVVPLLPSPPGAAIVTSRSRLDRLLGAVGAELVLLPPLDTAAALDLLADRIGRHRVDADRTAAVRIVRRVGGVPLALTAIAAGLAARPHRSLAGLTPRSTRPPLPEEAGMDDALDQSYEVLPPAAQRLYRLLGLYPGQTLDAAVAAALTGDPLDTAAATLDALTDANLLQDQPGEQYRLPSPVREHAGRRAAEESAANRSAALNRLAAWAAAAALHASRTAAPYRRLPAPTVPPDVPPLDQATTPAAALDWLDTRSPDLHAIARQAHQSGDHVRALQLATAVWPAVQHRAARTDQTDFDQLGLTAARALGDRAAQATMLNRIGRDHLERYRATGQATDLDEARTQFTEALTVWAALGDDRRVAGTRRRLAWTAREAGDPTSAYQLLRHALRDYQRLADDRHTALTSNDLADLHLATGNNIEAARAAERAHLLLKPTTDRYDRARALILLARAMPPGTPNARQLATMALNTMHQIASDTGQSEALKALAELADHDGKPNLAAKLRHRARTPQ